MLHTRQYLYDPCTTLLSSCISLPSASPAQTQTRRTAKPRLRNIILIEVFPNSIILIYLILFMQISSPLRQFKRLDPFYISNVSVLLYLDRYVDKKIGSERLLVRFGRGVKPNARHFPPPSLASMRYVSWIKFPPSSCTMASFRLVAARFPRARPFPLARWTGDP
jgi:hypothetical protein